MSTGLLLERFEVSRNGQRLAGIDAGIAPGEVLTLMGPSGSGKSSLAKAIAGFLPPSFSAQGKLRLDGADITMLPPEKRRIGMLFQDALLFPHFSVSENILFALPKGGSRTERCQRVADLLEPVGLADLLSRDPATLSGGQRARGGADAGHRPPSRAP